MVCAHSKANSKGRATRLDLSLTSHVCHKCNCTGNNAIAQFSLALSGEDNNSEVLLLFCVSQKDFLMKIFLERSVLAMLLTDTLVGTVHTNLRFLSSVFSHLEFRFLV